MFYHLLLKLYKINLILKVPEIETQEESSGANELQYFPHQPNHQETQNHLYHQYGHHHQIFLLSSISQQGTQSYYNLHPAVRTTAYIAMFFKVLTCFSVVYFKC